MKCEHCKNPVDQNSTICEWCGHQLVTTTTPSASADGALAQKSNPQLDEYLLSLIANNQKIQAIEHYKNTTGVSKENACKYIERLDFFKRYPLATDELFEKKYSELGGSKTCLGCLAYVILFPLSIFCLIGSLAMGTGAGDAAEPDATHLSGSDLVISVIVFIILGILFFYWGKKLLKKSKNLTIK